MAEPMTRQAEATPAAVAVGSLWRSCWHWRVGGLLLLA
eukprot:SAG31_NODE_22110_length_533_cov_1.529954_1_plen_37_part_10